MTVDSVDSLKNAVDQLNHQPYLVMGEGSNTVFVEDYPHTIVINKIKNIEYREDSNTHYLRVGAGQNWHELVTYCISKNIGGFENLALIPGTVGASPIQNIGAYGVEVERFIDKVEFYDTQKGEINYFSHHECEFGYRDSLFKRQTTNARIITHVFFSLPKHYELETSYGPLNNIQKTANVSAKSIYDAVIALRLSKLPKPEEFGNAGSFFKNPVITQAHFDAISTNQANPNIPHYTIDNEHVKIPAAWLIDQLGFKGKRVGDIACHVNQPLVLINCGKGTGEDLLKLAREIRDAVHTHFGITLENEVRLIGKDGLITL